jgi:zinc D-Ala-D-Ala carboxypeptidase
VKVSNWEDYHPYFAKAEFDCKHTGKNEMQVEFMDVLLAIRIERNNPMRITSGFRDVTHPIEARKTHSNGEHTKGMCCDVEALTGNAKYELVQLALKHGITRIGVAKTFLHLGLGAPGLPTEVVWLY